MRTVTPIEINAITVFDEITQAKKAPNQGHMTSARPRILQAYANYVATVPNVGGLAVAALTLNQKNSLHHAYESETKPMASLRAEILKVVRCPFCSISESSTLDHYLPKERYPEFSVLPINLIPSCSPCNTKKRDKILDRGTNIRKFLHPYFDAIPDLPFLNVGTRMAQGSLVLTYQIIQPVGMSAQTFQHISFHFSEMDLADRYRRMGLDHLGELYGALKKVYGPNQDPNRVANKLNERATEIEVSRGANYWLVKLLQALAVNLQFCDGGFEVIQPSI